VKLRQYPLHRLEQKRDHEGEYKRPDNVGCNAPTPKLVDQFFNDSTGEGDRGEVDARGPWNEGEPWEFVESPAFQDFNGGDHEGASIHA
jgi:Mn-containing catalase